MTTVTTYTTTEVTAMTGASYRQVDYWARTGRIPGQTNPGTGHYRRWTEEQVERVRLLMRASKLVNLTFDEALELLEP